MSGPPDLPSIRGPSQAKTVWRRAGSTREPYVDEKVPGVLTSRLITVNDLYPFDPGVQVGLEEFTDVVGRHFRQPQEGLGFDGSPAAHMWRTIMWPTRDR